MTNDKGVLLIRILSIDVSEYKFYTLNREKDRESKYSRHGEMICKDGQQIQWNYAPWPHSIRKPRTLLYHEIAPSICSVCSFFWLHFSLHAVKAILQTRNQVRLQLK